MTIKGFFFGSILFVHAIILSIFVHATILSIIHFIPAAKEKRPTELFTKLVSPQDSEAPPVKLPPGRIHRLPPFPSPLKAPSVSQYGLPRPLPLPPFEMPVVPGEGKETGRPLPQGMLPKEGEAGSSGGGKGKGDAKDTRNAIEPGKPGFSVKGTLKEIGDVLAKGDSAGSGGKAKKDDAITFDTEDYRYAGYMKLLKQKIESIWEYPPEEAAEGRYGDLKIRFSIKKDGRLGDISVVRTSGYPALDKAAVKALRDGEPYWPLPDNWKRETYTILGHFFYTIYGYPEIR